MRQRTKDEIKLVVVLLALTFAVIIIAVTMMRYFFPATNPAWPPTPQEVMCWQLTWANGDIVDVHRVPCEEQP